MKYLLLALVFTIPVLFVPEKSANLMVDISEWDLMPVGYSLSTTSHPYHPDMNRKSSNITWIRDPELVEKKLRALEKKLGYEVVGNATWKGGRCTIYALEPTSEYDSSAMDTLGHEVLHCMRGDYHD